MSQVKAWLAQDENQLLLTVLAFIMIVVGLMLITGVQTPKFLH